MTETLRTYQSRRVLAARVHRGRGVARKKIIDRVYDLDGVTEVLECGHTHRSSSGEESRGRIQRMCYVCPKVKVLI